MLAVRDLHTSYGGIAALHGISFDVPRGSVFALVGANGAGKSTTLNTISGLLAPRQGTIHFEDRDVTGWRAERIAALGLVQVPEGRQILAPLTVEENLLVGAYTRRDGAVRADLQAVCERFPRLAERRGQIAGSLSGGEQQMVAIARALMADPTLLMIDELSLGLAPVIMQEILRVVDDVAASGVTILLVEQSLNIALGLATTAHFMEKGEIRFSGESSELLERDDLVRSVFFGEIIGEIEREIVTEVLDA
jgi:branched-chain amino acid transport system ATP-binding protein